jgi:hypothetical protein
VLNLDGDVGPIGVVIDRRKGNKPIFKWRPENGVKYKIDPERQAAWAKKKEAEDAARDEKITKLKRWFYSLPPLDRDHEYLTKKQISPDDAVYAKRDGDKIVLPIFNIRTGGLQNVQTIAPDGSKLFQEGLTTKEGFIPCGYCGLGVAGQKPHKTQEKYPVVITEGWADGMAIAQSFLVIPNTGFIVISALSDGGLLGIARAVRECHRMHPILIAADNDAEKPDNPGLTAAYEAARAAGAKVAVPPPGDLNDLYRVSGPQAVYDVIAKADDPPADDRAADDSAADDPAAVVSTLDRMNAEFFVVSIGGKVGVGTFRKETSPNGTHREVLEFYAAPAFRLLKDIERIKIGSKSVGIASWWLKQPGRRTYSGLKFAPGQGEEDGRLNLWRGFVVEPRPGNWSLMREHIYNVLAAGSKRGGDYVIKWSAYAFQNPGTQAETALVFKGREGVGKGIFGREMAAIFGQHGMQISHASHLTGHFNFHLADLSLLFADEAFWPGDKSAEGTLKRLITEPTLVIEKKGHDVFLVNNQLHVIIASNNDWVVPAGFDARRFAVFDVSDQHMQDREYFAKIVHQMENGGREAMLYDLLNLDLGDWHPRNDIPQTRALIEQKERSLLYEDQWWVSLLEAGALPGAEIGNPTRAGSEALFEHARRTVPGLKTWSDHLLGKTLRKHGCMSVKMRNGKRGWQFDLLSELRRQWDRKMKRSRHRWENGTEWGDDGF